MKTNKTAYYPAISLREELRLQANAQAARLSRSVARLTSCDPQPCLEYADEVRQEHLLAEKLFYLQHCRNALERCIGSGSAALRYRWSDGTVTVTRFRMVTPSRVRTVGMALDK